MAFSEASVCGRPNEDFLITDDQMGDVMANVRCTVQAFMNRIDALDYLGAFGMLADDGRYTIIGKTKASGVYIGYPDLRDRLIPLLSTFIEPPKIKWQDPIIEGNRAVLLGSGAGKGPTGDYVQPHYVFVTRVRGDEFVEIIEFLDTVTLEEAAFGKKLVDA